MVHSAGHRKERQSQASAIQDGCSWFMGLLWGK